MNKRKSILTDIEKNYDDTKSISKTVDITSLENGVNPHTIYKDVFKKVDNDTPNDFPTEKISVGDIVYTDNNPNKQFEVITINNKNNIVIKDLSTNEVIETDENNIKKIMENIDMAKKKINETQYSVSINGLETTDANALSQMMSAAAQADSGNADVGGMDMTSTPELPTPEMGAMDPAINEPITSVESIPPAEDSVETFDEEPSFEDSDIEGMDDELPTDVENPLDNPEPEMDSFEDDFEPVVDDIEFDEEIEEPVENDLGINESQLNESRPDKEDFINSDTQNVDENVLQELYEIICEQMGDDYLSDYDEVDHMELLDCVKDFGREVEGFDEEFAEEYATALQEKWKEEHIDDGSDYEDYGRPNWEDNESDEDLSEDVTPTLEDKEGIPSGDIKVKVYNVKWDCDNDDPKEMDLPEEFEIEVYHDEDFDLDDEVSDAISDEYGYCHYGFDYDIINNDEKLSEDILLPKETEDETYNASKKLKNEEKDEESERISESMDALIKSILETADAKSEQEVYAEEISEADEGEDEDYEEIDDDAELEEVHQMFLSCKFSDDEIVEELVNRGFPEDFARDRVKEWTSNDIIFDSNKDFDSDIDECLKNAGVKSLKESIVKPTIVTDESSFANKPNKALKPEDKKTVEKKTVDTATFGKDASEGFKEPLNCIKCEAVSPKDKIKAIYETAKTRYANADKEQWNALDRRYIKKLIESGCGYTRASKIILEAKKKK